MTKLLDVGGLGVLDEQVSASVGIEYQNGFTCTNYSLLYTKSYAESVFGAAKSSHTNKSAT